MINEVVQARSCGGVECLQEVESSRVFTIALASVKAAGWREATLEEKNSLLDAMEAIYQRTRFEGYSIELFDDPVRGPIIRLEGHGKERPLGAELDGVPSAGHKSDNCPFCSGSVKGEELAQYGARHIKSLSGRSLLIPTKQPIPIHWFQADRQTQVNLLQAGQNVIDSLQRANPKASYYFALHCGEAGFQTVWHLHLRIEE